MSNMPFIKLMTEHRNGDTEAVCSDAVREVLDAIREHGGKGSVDVKLTFAMTDYGMVEVKVTVAAKAPKPKLKPSAFYLAADGTLCRTDPNQTEMDDVPGFKPERSRAPALAAVSS